MSNNQNFQPMTPQLGIAGSSYQLEIGKVNKYWAIRLVKSRDVLASKVYKDIPNHEEIPLGNHLTGWVLSVLAIPGINTYQIQKTIGFLRQKAMRTVEQQKTAKKTAGKSESSSVKLEKVPDNVQVKRHQASGFVKEDKTPVDTSNLSPALAASNQTAASRDAKVVAVGNRELAPIPKGPDFVLTPFVKKAGSPSQASSVLSSKASSRISANIASKLESQFESRLDSNLHQLEAQLDGKVAGIKESILESIIMKDLVKRIEQMEFQLQTLEKDNVELRALVKNLSS